MRKKICQLLSRNELLKNTFLNDGAYAVYQLKVLTGWTAHMHTQQTNVSGEIGPGIPACSAIPHTVAVTGGVFSDCHLPLHAYISTRAFRSSSFLSETLFMGRIEFETFLTIHITII